MDPPDFRQLLGFKPEATTQLFDYGYRAAWRVDSPRSSFIVKADERQDLTANEVAAQLHAGKAGIPVAEVVAFEPEFPATVAIRWVDGVSLHEHSTPAARRNAGRWLRVIHALPVLRPRLERPEHWLAESFESELSYMVESSVISDSDRTNALAAMEALLPAVASAPSSWIHGDCQAAHFLIDPSMDRVTAVVDWADAQHGSPEMDFAVLTLFDTASLNDILDGYEASAEMRERLSLLFYQAVRGAGSYRWLVKHHYGKQQFTIDLVKALAATAR